MVEGSLKTNLLVALLVILITVIIADILILIILIEVTLKVLLAEALELAGLSGEPIDSTGNKLLLDILTELVVKLEALLNISSLFIILIKVGGRLGRAEEVEERLGRNSALDNASLLGVCS